MNQLPFYADINIELKSNCAPAPGTIGKPMEESSVREAFKKTVDINATLIIL